jgi:hypothetical protein
MKKGDIITIIGVSSFGMCNRAEFKYYGEIYGKHAVTENKKGARKKFVMPDVYHNKKDYLTFLGEVPNKIMGEIARRSESGMMIRTMHGNCCLNIYGTVEEVKALVEQNLNEDFTRYDAVMALDPETDKMTPVYPDVPTESHPVRDIRAKVTA